MDSLTLRAVAAELAPYRGLRLERIHAPDPWELRLVLEKDVTMVACVHPDHNALFPTAGAEGGGSGLPFARSLEKTLGGSRFAGARQAGLDRVIALAFESRDRLGDARRYHLVAEFTGKGANLVLVEGDEPWTGRILDRLRDDRSRHHPDRLAAGAPYALPSIPRLDTTADPPEALTTAVREALARRGPVPQALMEAWAGLGRRAAETVWSLAGPHPDTDPERLTRAWTEFEEATRPAAGDHPAGARFAPTLVMSPDGTGEAHCFEPPAAGPGTGARASYPTAAAAVAAAHGLFREHVVDARYPALRRPVRQAIARNVRALAALDRDEAEAQAAGRLRRMGEALLAAMGTIPRGAERADVVDHHTGETLTVELDPRAGAGENAERYFKRAKRAERAGDKVDRRRRELEKRGQALEELLRELGVSEGGGPAPDWFDRAATLGVKIPPEETPGDSARSAEDRLPASLKPRCYDMGGGWQALVGKSNRGNEVLTHEIARPHETWMHADQAAGSHLVLRHHEKGKEPPREVLLAAAAIAAHFSKARGSSKVPVLVTEKRHVRRPRRAPVGTVTVGRHKTVMVSPANPDRQKT